MSTYTLYFIFPPFIFPLFAMLYYSILSHTYSHSFSPTALLQLQYSHILCPMPSAGRGVLLLQLSVPPVLCTLRRPSKNAGTKIASCAILVPLRFWQSGNVPAQGTQARREESPNRKGKPAGGGHKAQGTCKL